MSAFRSGEDAAAAWDGVTHGAVGTLEKTHAFVFPSGFHCVFSLFSFPGLWLTMF